MQRFFRSTQQPAKNEVITRSRETLRFPSPAKPNPSSNQDVITSATLSDTVLTSSRIEHANSSASLQAAPSNPIRESLRSPPPPPKVVASFVDEVHPTATTPNSKTRGTVDDTPLPRATNITAALEANRLGSARGVSPILPLSNPAKEENDAKEPSLVFAKISHTSTESEDILENTRDDDQLAKESRTQAATQVGRHSLPGPARRVRFCEPLVDEGLIFVSPSDVFSDAEEEDVPNPATERRLPSSRSFLPPPRVQRDGLQRSRSLRAQSDLMSSSSLSQHRQERQRSYRFAPNPRRRSENGRSPVRGAFGAAASLPSRLKQLWYPKPEVWGEGIKAAFLYLPDSDNVGHARSALRGTKLAGMSTIHHQREIVRPGMPFKIQVVGTNLGVSAKKTQARAAISETVVKHKNENLANLTLCANHAPREGSGCGYMAVPDRRGLVIDACANNGESGVNEIRELSMHVVLGDVKKTSVREDTTVLLLKHALQDGTRHVNRDITWEICDRTDNRTRRRAIALRYGYFFILGEACSLRLYCQAATPEHMRLVAMTQTSRGSTKKELPNLVKNLSYIVVRVSEA